MLAWVLSNTPLILIVNFSFLFSSWSMLLTYIAPRAAGSGTDGCRGRSLLPCTDDVECRKTTLFWGKLNELSENISFDSEFVLAFEIQPFKVAFFVFFLMLVFQSIPGLNGLNKSISLVQKWNIAVFGIFFLSSKRNRQKKQIQNLYWFIINSLSPTSHWQQHRYL